MKVGMKIRFFIIFTPLLFLFGCGDATQLENTSFDSVSQKSSYQGASPETNIKSISKEVKLETKTVFFQHSPRIPEQMILKKREISNNFPKINPMLVEIASKLTERGITSTNAKRFKAREYSNPLIKVNDFAKIQAYIYPTQISADILSGLKDFGVDIEIVNESLKIVQCWIPFNEIQTIAELPLVKRIDVPNYAKQNEGSVMSEGDSIHRGYELRSIGLIGSGVKVGVLSDGVNNMADAIATGDLSAGITVFGTCTSASTCNEGTAMLEIVHDIAPGAELGFGAVATSLEFIDQLNKLVNDFGANIVVDDLGFFGEPMLVDGPVAEAVRAAANGGVLYITAAGNDAQKHNYGAGNVGAFEIVPGIPMVNFGSAYNSVMNTDTAAEGDYSIDTFILPGGTITVYLQWAADWNTSEYDDTGLLDLGTALLDSTESFVLAGSDIIQDGSYPPYEAFTFTNPLSEILWTKLVVYRSFGASQSTIRLILRGDAVYEYITPTISIFGHPALTEVITVGAIARSGEGYGEIQSYSSLGPARIGHPGPVLRDKPDLVAVDGISVTGSGGFPTPFYGTSATAPHVAGLAALLFEISNNPITVRNALQNSAIDLSVLEPDYDFYNWPPFSYDHVYGHGLVDVYAAALELNSGPNSTINTPSGNVTITAGKSVSFAGSCESIGSNDNTTYLWSFGSGSGIENSAMQNPGGIIFPNAGTFNVVFTCIDALGIEGPTPSSRTVTVVSAVPGDGSTSTNNTSQNTSGGGGGNTSSNVSNGGGGGCSFIGLSHYEKGGTGRGQMCFMLAFGLLFLACVLIRIFLKNFVGSFECLMGWGLIAPPSGVN